MRAMKTVPLLLVMLLMMSLTDTLGVEMSDSHVKHSKVPKIGRTTAGLPFSSSQYSSGLWLINFTFEVTAHLQYL